MKDERVTVEISGLYSPIKAAAYLGITTMTLWRWDHEKGYITSVMIDHAYYTKKELDRVKLLRLNKKRLTK